LLPRFGEPAEGQLLRALACPYRATQAGVDAARANRLGEQTVGTSSHGPSQRVRT